MASHVRWVARDQRHAGQPPKAHWTHLEHLGALCRYMTFTDDEINPAVVPAEHRCRSDGCRQAWEAFDRGAP